MGSPPRVRGKVTGFHYHARYMGITPACAGKRLCRTHATPITKDHPRVCGEKNVYYELGQQKPGSPPRVRGKADISQNCACFFRITPACAGKSQCNFSIPRTAGDHPRVCGEKSAPERRTHAGRGSPPRVRGKAGPNSAHNMASGITPACAGKRFKVGWFPSV